MDFIFVVLVEECGFVGVGVVFFFYFVYFVGGVKIVLCVCDCEGVLLSVGFFVVFCIYVFYNSVMVIGFVLVIGILIFFLSYGGLFIFFSFFVMGFVFNVEC